MVTLVWGNHKPSLLFTDRVYTVLRRYNLIPGRVSVLGDFEARENA